MQNKKPEELRSYRWFQQSPPGPKSCFGPRSRTMQNGYSLQEFAGRPVVGIINTWSDLSTCHGHLRERAQVVKRGVWQAGGFAVELPAMGLGEVMVKPSSMMYRNFLAMETEELIRQHPVDGVVMLGGCDKTTPGLVLGALSANVPAIYVPAGFMLGGHFRGESLGSGTSIWKLRDDLIAGDLPVEDWLKAEEVSSRTVGTCNTMGTASTMASIAESLGLCLPGSASVAAVDALHSRNCAEAGRRIVDLIWQGQTIRQIVSREAVENAVVTCLAAGGSTNAVIHLTAMARRAGHDFSIDEFDRLGREVPLLANVKPAGKYLMDDFQHAGGILALQKQLERHLHLDCMTVNGKTLGENIADAKVHNDDVVRAYDNPIAHTALAVVRGNIAPRGAMIKPAAASEKLMSHRGKALVWDSAAEMDAEIHSDDLDCDENTVFILRNIGPQGAPGMPEWGMMPVPRKLLKQGIRDCVRLSDARMSGTAFGTCLLHITPEAAIGGPLSLVKTGDWIELDVPNRRVHLDISDEEMERRKACWQAPPRHYERGYGSLFLDHILQADEGCDFDFLRDGEPIPEPQIR